MVNTPATVTALLRRASEYWLERKVWQHKSGQASMYHVTAAPWVIEQAAHVRRQCFAGITSRAFALSLTLEKDGCVSFYIIHFSSACSNSIVMPVQCSHIAHGE